jgi:hypothetical protein
MALKRLVRQEGAAGNVVDDVSVKHASSSDAVGTITPSQIASASALNDINANYIKTIKVNGIVQPKSNNEVNLPQWQTINNLVIKNSPTDANPVIYNGSGAVTLDLSQKVVVGDINTLLLQHGGTTAVQYNGKAPGAQTFNINTLTVNQGSSANQTTYNGGIVKTLNLQNLKIRNFQDTENASLTYNTFEDKTLSFPRLQLVYLGTPYNFDTTPSASLGGSVSTITLPPPTVSVGTLTLQQNGTNVGTYSGAATTINFSVPTSSGSNTFLGQSVYSTQTGWGSLSINCSTYHTLIIMYTHWDGSIAHNTSTSYKTSIMHSGNERYYVQVVKGSAGADIAYILTNQNPSTNSNTTFSITTPFGAAPSSTVDIYGIK